MKKLITGLALLLMVGFAKAQNGLEQIVVEKYYVSNAADAAGSVGSLPAGSNTWRVYADLLPGYTLQAVYGVAGHNLLITSSTTFFNNEDYGSTTPNGISVTNSRKNSVMIDSWFSMGGNAAGKVAVLKTEDSDGALVNTSAPQILQNNDASAGIPINTQDGMINGIQPNVTFVGISNTGNGDLGVFDGTSQVGGNFSTSNGSIAVLGGVSGPTAANRILIGQFTTTGIFHFELNLQIGTPSAGAQNFVASNPVGSEISIPSLTGTFGVPNVLPTISISSPSNNATFVLPNVVTIDANANDPDGTITNVEFLVDNVVVGSDNSAPYSYNWTAVLGTHVLKARATDNNGGQTTSSGVTVIVGNNISPTISITSPSNGTPFLAPSVVNITTNANDPDGTVTQVEFFVDNVSVGIDNSAPFDFGWISGAPFGARHLKAVATDNNGATTNSAIITINVADPNALPYTVVSTTNNCEPSLFCQTVRAVDTVTNVIGYDIVMHYDAIKVTPTGVITVNNALINPAYVTVINSIDVPNSNINISLFFNGTAPSNAEFHGTGDLICIQFAKTGNFASVDTAVFSISELQESYVNGVVHQPADMGSYITYKDSSFVGSLKFWANNGAMPYNTGNPGQFLITNIYGNNSSCNSQSVTAVQPDLAGNFTYSTGNGEYLTITKDIASGTNVQPVINGFDAFLARRILINDASFLPNIFQLISADVNLDGVISAGDISQINQRTVLINPEFKQAWNYDLNGSPLGPLSKDWIFIDLGTLNTDPSYVVSSSYPMDDGIGASKYNVPVVSFCLPVPSSGDTSSDCEAILSETYKGILLGDLNGNYATVANNGTFKMIGINKIIFDLTNATAGNGYVDVPVSVLSMDAINALDFSIGINDSKFTFNSIIGHASYIESLTNLNANDRTLRFTSNSLQQYEIGKPVVTVRFNTEGSITKDDLSVIEGYLNGDRVEVGFITGTSPDDYNFNIFPNPASNEFNIIVTEDATVQLFDIRGCQVMAPTVITANQTHTINTENLAAGVYTLKVYNAGFSTNKKIVIQK